MPAGLRVLPEDPGSGVPARVTLALSVTRARLLAMLLGAIVAESLRLGAVVEGVPLVVRKLERIDAGVEEQPPQWTLLWFEADEADAGRLAAVLADALEAEGGWYADFHSDAEVAVIFAGRISAVHAGTTPSAPGSPTTRAP